MRILTLITIILLTHDICGQDLIVAESDKAFYVNGEKINHKDVIIPGTNVRVERKGKLSINYKQRWSLYFEKGIHNVDSVLRIETEKPEFILHDSIYSILDEKGLVHCRFDYKKGPLSGSYHPVPVDDIKIANPRDLTLTSDEIKIEWTHPGDYSGSYYFVVMNLFEEYIGIFQLKEPDVNLDLQPFAWSTNALLYKVIADDCRESEVQMLRRKINAR